MAVVQQLSASDLDAKLPNRPFAAWFNEVVGQDAGVVWQLAECGAPVGAPGGTGQDLPACAEASVILPNGNRMIVAISVGTFKKGVTGGPAFFRAVIDSGEQIYQVRRLSDLPRMVRAPGSLPRVLPDIQTGPPRVKLFPYTAYLPPFGLNSAPSLSREGVTPPAPLRPPTLSGQPRKVSEGVLEGSAITKRMPVYPPSARSMNAYGKVEVRIIVSETGRVIEATAISGHPALRSAAVDAARQWVYKPTTLNGVPVKVESILTFIFAPGG